MFLKPKEYKTEDTRMISFCKEGTGRLVVINLERGNLLL